MSGCWEFWRVFARATPVIAALLLISPILVTWGEPGESQDLVNSVFNEYKSPPRPTPSGSAEVDAQYHQFQMTQERNRLIATGLLAATAVAAHIILLSILRKKPATTPGEIVFGTGLIYIVFGTILLVILTDNKDQLTASTGILGAIVGYLFGSSGRRDRGNEPRSEEPEPRHDSP